MNAQDRLEIINSCLNRAFDPKSLTVIDESARHIGHAGARDGRGHFTVEIVSEVFCGLTLLDRHRAVYAVLGELMQTDIHALSIKATAPEAG